METKNPRTLRVIYMTKKIKEVINLFLGEERVALEEATKDREKAIDAFGRGNTDPTNRKGDLLLMVYEDDTIEALGEPEDLHDIVDGTLSSLDIKEKKPEEDKFYVYSFYWSDNSFELLINEKNKNKIKKLLDEYKKDNKDYNDMGWSRFLRKKGYKVRSAEPAYELYF